MNILKPVTKVTALIATLALTACNKEEFVLFFPKGYLGQEQADLILIAFALMLLVVIPVLIMSVWFPWKYREDRNAEYQPEWSHSTVIEIVVWVIPIIIILALGTITYITSHSMDPRKSLVGKYNDRGAKDTELNIQVMAMDWKWLFIYPEQDIATVNEIAVPVNTPLKFLITSDTVMNSFFIPELGGQIYAMGGMENQMHLISGEEGVFKGLSNNYSGFGFSGMKFKVHSVSDEGFDTWVAKVKSSDKILNDAEYKRLVTKTKDHPVEHFNSVTDKQFFEHMILKYNEHR